jgi:hypothetical protein
MRFEIAKTVLAMVALVTLVHNAGMLLVRHLIVKNGVCVFVEKLKSV